MKQSKIKIPQFHPKGFNQKPAKIGGGTGIKAPANIAKALGVSPDLPVHSAAVQGLVNHPDANVAKAARKLLKKY